MLNIDIQCDRTHSTFQLVSTLNVIKRHKALIGIEKNEKRHWYDI